MRLYTILNPITAFFEKLAKQNLGLVKLKVAICVHKVCITYPQCNVMPSAFA